MDLEDELGAQLFERRPRGVRLTAAGEVFVHYLREQNGDVERMKSQIEDLKGLRRGTVRIACSQALALDFLPREIAEFRKRHPLVSFDVRVLDHEQAMAALAAYEVDLVLVFRPPFLAELPAADEPRAAPRRRHVGRAIRSPASAPSGCATARPIPSPCRSAAIGGRQLLDEVSARSGLTFRLAAESNSFELLRGLVTHANLISFQIRIGTMPENNKLGLVARDIDDRDVPRANLVLGQLRARNLPIPAAVFAEKLVRVLEAMRGDTGQSAAAAASR